MNGGILFFLYHAKINALKYLSSQKIEKIRNGLAESETEFVKISLKDFNNPHILRKLSENEFVYREKLYDIISYEVSNDSIFIICLHDRAEEEFILKQSFHRATAAQILYQFHKKDYANTYKTLLTVSFATFSDISNRNYKHINPALKTQNLSDVPTPPPKLKTQLS